MEVYYSQGCERQILIDGDEQLDLNEVRAVWYRRIAIGARIPKTMDLQLRQASIGESRVTVMGMIASIKGFHLDPMPNIRRG
ncbi:MAG: hypothetical protein HXY43_09235 [Fischerella sp.]|uniref:MvdC/MvdD family ATP grasp protein n=1 Tax=Fischerella sp. TaxID=1191 RepID=UPI0017A89D7B|nr:hypothetical protein [Fischerella sp.]